MNLKQFLASCKGNPEKVRELAEAAGTTVNYLQQIAGGARRPRTELALAIQAASKGRVKATELLLAPKKPAHKKRRGVSGRSIAM